MYVIYCTAEVLLEVFFSISGLDLQATAYAGLL